MTDQLGNLLIVDDEPGITHVLSLLLRKHVSDIKVAGNGKEALEIIHNYPFDVVITDVNMPEMDGFSLLAQVRELGNETPFVFISAISDDEKLQKARALGFTHFLEKPFEPETIIGLIRNTIYGE